MQTRTSCMRITLSVRKPNRIGFMNTNSERAKSSTLSWPEDRISRSYEEKAQAFHETEMRCKTSEFKQAIEVTLADAQQLLQEQASNGRCRARGSQDR